jgi:hypothetical protein
LLLYLIFGWLRATIILACLNTQGFIDLSGSLQAV